MKKILILLQKEFIQVFRNKTILPIIFVLPIVQLLILANAATQEMKNIKLALIDFDNSSESRSLVNAFDHSKFYSLIPVRGGVEKAVELIDLGEADAVLVIPEHFGENLVEGTPVNVQLMLNAINITAAALTQGYTSGIIQGYTSSISIQSSNIIPTKQSVRHWYNPDLNYKLYMVPGILVILVTIVGMFLTAINIVREKELGTIEQVNVTPIKPYQFIVGKLVPFWIIALFELSFGLIIAKLVFNLTIVGSTPLLFGFAAIYLLVALGLGLILSTSASNQQQVMFMAFFFMIVFLMLSGLFTPTESMPKWAQWFNTINPLYYFMKVNRMLILKGSDFGNLRESFISISLMAIAVLSFAILRYNKKSA
jgi:ABC-2 type transport system permease protein